VLYFEAYVVVDPGMTPLKRGQLLTDEMYLKPSTSTATSSTRRMGAEASASC
jgi:DNA-directed RNA polymerase subunit beta'